MATIPTVKIRVRRTGETHRGTLSIGDWEDALRRGRRGARRGLAQAGRR